MDEYCIDRISVLYCRLKALVYDNMDSKAIHSHAGNEPRDAGRRERTVDRNQIDYSKVYPLMFNR